MKYIFTEKQFAALLAVNNTGTLYSFELPCDIDDIELIEAIHTLYQRKWICEKNGHFSLCPALEEMIGTMKAAEQIARIQLSVPWVPQRLIYPGNEREAVILECCRSLIENSVKLQRGCLDSLLLDILENELAAFSFTGLDAAEEESCLADTWQGGTQIFQLERIGTAGQKPESHLSVWSNPFLCWIDFNSGKDDKHFLYSEARFSRLFWEIMGGKES